MEVLKELKIIIFKSYLDSLVKQFNFKHRSELGYY